MSALRRRLRCDDGFVLPGAMALLAIFLLMTAVAVTVSLSSLERTNRDRQLVRALQAADAGADVALRRMNRMLVSPSVGGVLGIVPGTLQQLGCMRVAAAGVEIEPLSGAGWCDPQPVPAETLGDGSSYVYQVSSGVTVSTALGDLMERRILATGTAGDVQRRVLVTIRLALFSGDDIARFERVRHVECTAEPTGAAPDSGCPPA